MSEYNGVIKTYTVPNLYEGVLPAIPADLSISESSWNAQIIHDQRPSSDVQRINPQSNILLRKFGLFSNFADGLVQKTPTARLTAKFQVRAAERVSVTGQADFTAGSKTVTGVGSAFTTDFSIGDYISDRRGNIYAIATISDDTNLTLSQYAVYSQVAGTYYRMDTTVSLYTYYHPDINQLNMMYEINHFIPIASIGSQGSEQTIIIVDIEHEVGPIEYYTKSIYTGFSGAVLTFDGLLDIEFTCNNDTDAPV